MDRRRLLTTSIPIITATALCGCLRASNSTPNPREQTETSSERKTTTTTETEDPAIDPELGWQSNTEAISGTIGRDHVFVQTADSLVALDRNNGDTVWSHNEFSKIKALTEPVLHNGNILIGRMTSNNNATIYKLNGSNGNLVNQIDLEVPLEESTFSIENIGLFTIPELGTDGSVRSDTTGVIALDMPLMEEKWRIENDYCVIAVANEEFVINRGETAYSGENIQGVAPQTGTVNWSVETSPMYRSIAIGDGAVYGATVHDIYQNKPSASESSLLFTVGSDIEDIAASDGYIISGLSNGVVVIDETGEIQWKRQGLNINEVVVSDNIAWLAGDALTGIEVESGKPVKSYDPAMFASFDGSARSDWVEIEDGLLLSGHSEHGVFTVKTKS